MSSSFNLLFKDQGGNDIANAELRFIAPPTGGPQRWTLKLLDGAWYAALDPDYYSRGSLYIYNGQNLAVYPHRTEGLKAQMIVFKTIPLQDGTFPFHATLVGEAINQVVTGSVVVTSVAG